MAESDANPDVRKNIQRLYQQVGRMENLIKGILDYSSVGSGRRQVEEVDSFDLVSGIGVQLDLRPDQLRLEGDFPVFETDVVRVEQVFSNLMENARKYHHDPDHALLTVEVNETSDFYVFSVADNGPGIDPKFHARIFEVFQTLQSRDVVESTGVGLSIVKKAVEDFGGEVRVVSEPGNGAKFIFDWPKTIEGPSAYMAAA